jgi:transcriptional regulator with XRE-family HTH domain
MAGCCERCGAPGSPSGAPASCAACQLPSWPAPGALVAAASWHPAASGDRRGNLGAILRGYRHAGGLTQHHLADLLGFDRTYISMIERGRRSIADRGTLAHIARTLAISPNVLGITDPDDADFTAMLAFGASVIRLAGVARHGGRAADAAGELWPLITRLQARVAAGHAEPEAMRLLARAQVSFGVALGHLLPEEQLATAARWTGRALRIAGSLGDRALLASVLRMHGNELRKAGHVTASITRLRQSLQIDDHPACRGSALVLLARAAAESGQAELFDTVAGQCVQALKATKGDEVLFNAFTVREVRIRGLLATGRTGQAVDLAESLTVGDRPPTPQWRVIERITTADVLARAGDEHTAAGMLSAALSDAETLRLPHQVQRIIRLAGQPSMLTGQPVRARAKAVLTRLDRQLAEATSSTGNLWVDAKSGRSAGCPLDAFQLARSASRRNGSDHGLAVEAGKSYAVAAVRVAVSEFTPVAHLSAVSCSNASDWLAW